MKKIVYFPLEERPCNYEFPCLLKQWCKTSHHKTVYRLDVLKRVKKK